MVEDKKMFFQSPTYGLLDMENLKKVMLKYMGNQKTDQYRLIIGTDSQPKNNKGADFVTAILIHHIGYGGIYFWQRFEINKQMSLKERIYQEATTSLIAAENLLLSCNGNGITKFNLEIHVDIGSHGETRELISEVVGMIRGSGYICKTKPDSFGASKVADRHT
jgi:hypothetical protein